MGRQNPVEPRKRPVQGRSRETVHAIREASARILAREGIEHFNTNRIACVAGVSVGSLYQYFPNKEALVRSLIGERVRLAEAKRPPELGVGSDTTLEEGIRASVAWHIAVHLENPRLEAALNRLAAEVLGWAEVEAFERRYEEAVRSFLERHAHRLRVGDVAIAAFLVMRLLHTATNHAVVHHCDALSDGRLEREMTAMILRYLVGGEGRTQAVGQ